MLVDSKEGFLFDLRQEASIYLIKNLFLGSGTLEFFNELSLIR